MQRIVIKLGTSTLTAGTTYLNRQKMLELVQQIAYLYQSGYDIVIVSSGAQAAGRERLNFPELNRSLPARQMMSAIGQSRLMRTYSDLFDIFSIVVAQVLLTRDDLSNRSRYLNARDTMVTLLDHRIIPIINENDTIATEEIRVGDNDNLSALVASAIEADLLIILTDQAGLYTADPRINPDAELIAHVPAITDDIFALAQGTATATGTGGMVTKLQAASLAAKSGVDTIIASGSEPEAIARIAAGENVGTRFSATSSHLESRKRWILTDRVRGTVTIDAGAVRALTAADGASLLPVGITDIQGSFKRSATVAIIGPDNRQIAHGLTNYDSDELRKIRGQKSSSISELLGYTYGDAAVHRNNMVMIV